MLETLPNGASSNGSNGAANGSSAPVHTITSLRRWSCEGKPLPEVQEIKSIHVYDFDNTLFASPLPNRNIWAGPTVGQLQLPDVFVNGGWWHDSAILASTGKGIEKEEAQAWKGWWNEHIVTLVELSMQQKDALNVLLTGRSESQFADIVRRIVASRKLHFHMICLKPMVGPNNQKFSSTMQFKQDLLKDLVYTYTEADEIRIYEDRGKHVEQFRNFFTTFNKALLSPDPPIARKTITAEVVHVAENATSLDPTIEIAEVQRMINGHNLAVRDGIAPVSASPFQIKRTVFFTGYLISPGDSEKLQSLVSLPPHLPRNEVRFLANNILITPRPCPPSLLERAGGLGYRLTWRVTGIAVLESRLWAARVEPVPSTAKYYTDTPTPTVVLALRHNARPADVTRIQNWQPVHTAQAYEFEAVVGEKIQLRVEKERAGESEWESMFPYGQSAKRSHPREEDFPPLGSSVPKYSHVPQAPGQRRDHSVDGRRRSEYDPGRGGGYRGGNPYRGRGTPRSGRGGRGGHSRGGAGSSRGRGRGGGPSHYRSLDDVGERPYGGHHAHNYDDGVNQSGSGHRESGSLYNAY